MRPPDFEAAVGAYILTRWPSSSFRRHSQWRAHDREAVAWVNAHPKVVETFWVVSGKFAGRQRDGVEHLAAACRLEGAPVPEEEL